MRSPCNVTLENIYEKISLESKENVLKALKEIGWMVDGASLTIYSDMCCIKMAFVTFGPRVFQLLKLLHDGLSIHHK